MSIGPLKRRSSWPSSFVTGLIGWNGFFVILAVILGEMRSAGRLFLYASAAAIVQVLALRLLFFILRMDRSMIAGGIAGGASAAVVMFVGMRLSDLFDAHPILWMLNAVYIGIAVGLFLSYFYRDDRKIESEAASNGVAVDYGRDANWLEPFFFGAVAYLVAFVPRSLDLAMIVAVIGAVSGVVAAGVSHFFVFTTARRSIWPIMFCLVAGIVQGALTGFLFISFANELFFSPAAHGAIAGALTYLMTAIRGRSLAGAEAAAEVD